MAPLRLCLTEDGAHVLDQHSSMLRTHGRLSVQHESPWLLAEGGMSIRQMAHWINPVKISGVDKSTFRTHSEHVTSLNDSRGDLNVFLREKGEECVAFKSSGHFWVCLLKIQSGGSLTAVNLKCQLTPWVQRNTKTLTHWALLDFSELKTPNWFDTASHWDSLC